jgi:hypothetical protein
VAKFVGRFRFINDGARRHIDGEPTSHERFEREMHLHPSVDPGDPAPGRSIEDEETEEERELREVEERRKRGEACDCNEEPSPMEQFQRASDQRWGIGKYRRGADAALQAAPRNMTPIERFQDASDRRWGVGRYRSEAAEAFAALPKNASPMDRFIAASKARWNY